MLSFSKPIAVLQLEQSNPRTALVVWQWSTAGLTPTKGLKQIAQQPF